MHASISARFLCLASCPFVAFVTSTTTVVVCKPANGGSASAARSIAGNLLVAILASVTMVAFTATIVVQFITHHGTMAAASACARFLGLAIVSNPISIADAATISLCFCPNYIAITGASMRTFRNFAIVTGIAFIADTLTGSCRNFASWIRNAVTVAVEGAMTWDLKLTFISLITIVTVASTVIVGQSSGC